MPRMDAQEKKWRAESDADTLRRAAELQSDRTRLTAARRELERQQKATVRAIGFTPKEAFRRGGAKKRG
jgi:hypothetical protein